MAGVKILEVVIPGPLTTLQDQGRFGFGQYGVAQSGAVDSFSLRVGNLMVGNPENEAGLEITFMGPVMEALANMAIAITGADLQPRINGRPVPMWRTIVLQKGDILSFKRPKSGCRAYLAVGGGFNAPTVLGSKSTSLGGRFGGLEGRPLQRGDMLFCNSPHLHLDTEGRSLPTNAIPQYPTDCSVKVIMGPHHDHFSPETLTLFQESSFRVTEQSDRTGIRLAGPPLKAKEGFKKSIISEGVVPGAIQTPGDGQPIIILGETVTGGYRKIAVVISADLHRLGQLKPGNRVSFVAVSQDEAFGAFKKIEAIIRSIISPKKPNEKCRCQEAPGLCLYS